MLIDWFTLVAQIVNFLILVWLLKRFLWTKLIGAIDERENRITVRLTDADQKDKAAEAKLAEMNARASEQERERTELLARAKRDANEVRLELIQKARETVREQETTWREDLEREKSAFLEDLRQKLSAEILAVVRRALADLAGADVQRCAIDVFLQKLQSVDVSLLRELTAHSVNVLSASDLRPDTRSRIESALTARLGQAVSLQFARRPGMSWGIELRSNGRAIGWTPDSYLESLDESLRKALEARPKILVG